MDLAFINEYYTNKIKEHGVSSKGVDWKDSISQNLRFDQLLRSFQLTDTDSILDYGSGYGALLVYIQKSCKFSSYYGYDISQAMIDEAEKIFSNEVNVQWSTNYPSSQRFSYVFLSGIFNVRNEVKDDEWFNYIIETLNTVNGTSERGFSFNILSKYSDAEYRKEYLYYADPLILFDYCKTKFSKYVTLYHDYQLYEFTISVIKET